MGTAALAAVPSGSMVCLRRPDASIVHRVQNLVLILDV